MNSSQQLSLRPNGPIVKPVRPPLQLDWATLRTIRMTIMPDVAAEWLKSRNTHNRPMSDSHWYKLAVDMIDGRWQYNGDSIRFSREGVLIDGQHRLKACVEANVPLDTDVKFGLDPECLDTIDDPMVRTAANQLSLRGVQNSSQVAAIAALVLTYRKHGGKSVFQPSYKPTKRQSEAFAIEDWGHGAGPRLLQLAANGGAQINRRLGIPPRIAGFCYYVFAEQSPEKASRLFSELSSGAVSRENPAYLLQERLVSNKGAKARLTPIELLALFFLTWISYRDDRPRKVLRWRSEGPSPESFPSIEQAQAK